MVIALAEWQPATLIAYSERMLAARRQGNPVAALQMPDRQREEPLTSESVVDYGPRICLP
jgi:hypothetical protein